MPVYRIDARDNMVVDSWSDHYTRENKGKTFILNQDGCALVSVINPWGLPVVRDSSDGSLYLEEPFSDFGDHEISTLHPMDDLMDAKAANQRKPHYKAHRFGGSEIRYVELESRN